MPRLSHPRTVVRPYRRRRRSHDTCPPPAYRSRSDAAHWQYLEECEFGRLAQEADHLFDTSLSW